MSDWWIKRKPVHVPPKRTLLREVVELRDEYRRKIQCLDEAIRIYEEHLPLKEADGQAFRRV